MEPAIQSDRLRWIKRLIWTYFWLLIFEGSLRKWILPQFSNQLLIIRDPVALAIYALAIRAGCFPRHRLLSIAYIIGGLSLLCSFFVGRGNVFITLYGFRANFLHLPLIFVIGNTLSREDLKKLGYATLFLAAPTAILMTLQFLAPPDSLLNRGTLGKLGTESGQIESALGRIRPAAFFSYNTGAGQYLALLTAFVLFGLLTKQFWLGLLYIGGVSILLAVAVSGSRTTVSTLVTVVVALVVIWFLKPKAVGRVPAVVIGVLIVYLVVQRFEIFHEGLFVLQTRSQDAFESEPFLVRMAYDFALPLTHTPFFGHGLGVGTNVGSAVLTGELVFLLSEGEWARNVLESGPVLGSAFVLWRLALAAYLCRLAYRAVRESNFLPWLILAAVVSNLLKGNLGQPTSLGFAVFGAGLCWAAINEKSSETAMAKIPLLPEVRKLRGRSVYAEQLHGRT